MVDVIEAGQRYFTWAQASRYCGLSEMTLRRLVKAKQLRLLLPRKGCPRFDKRDLDIFMQGRCGPETSPAAK
jgi:excisionase family DNA binding protein